LFDSERKPSERGTKAGARWANIRWRMRARKSRLSAVAQKLASGLMQFDGLAVDNRVHIEKV
jgi:hypothetical protein